MRIPIRPSQNSRSCLNRFYYLGIIRERQGKSAVDRRVPGSNHNAYEWFHEAMALYEKAEALAPSGNDDAILRWNTCARQIELHNLTERVEEEYHPMLE